MCTAWDKKENYSVHVQRIDTSIRDVFVAIWLLVQQHKLGGTHAWLLHTRSTCSVRYSNLLPTRKGKLVISMSCVLSTFLKVGSKLVLHIFTSSSCFLSLSCTVTLSGSSGSYSVHALLYLPFPIFPSSRRSTSWQQKVYYEGRCQRWYNAVGFEVHQQSLSIILPCFDLLKLTQTTEILAEYTVARWALLLLLLVLRLCAMKRCLEAEYKLDGS